MSDKPALPSFDDYLLQRNGQEIAVPDAFADQLASIQEPGEVTLNMADGATVSAQVTPGSATLRVRQAINPDDITGVDFGDAAGSGEDEGEGSGEDTAAAPVEEPAATDEPATASTEEPAATDEPAAAAE